MGKTLKSRRLAEKPTTSRNDVAKEIADEGTNWVLIYWAVEKKYTVQPEDSVQDAYLLQDSTRVGDIVYTGEGPDRLRPPYHSAKRFLGSVIAKDNVKANLERMLLEKINNPSSAPVTETIVEPSLAQRGPTEDSPSWAFRRRLIAAAETSSSDPVPVSDASMTEISQLPRICLKLLQKQKDLENRIQQLENARADEKNKGFMTKEDVIALIESRGRDTSEAILQAEAKLLRYAPEDVIIETKRLIAYLEPEKASMELVDAIFKEEVMASSMKTLDQEILNIVLEFVLVSYEKTLKAADCDLVKAKRNKRKRPDAITHQDLRDYISKAIINRKQYGKKKMRQMKETPHHENGKENSAAAKGNPMEVLDRASSVEETDFNEIFSLLE